MARPLALMTAVAAAGAAGCMGFTHESSAWDQQDRVLWTRREPMPPRRACHVSAKMIPDGLQVAAVWDEECPQRVTSAAGSYQVLTTERPSAVTSVLGYGGLAAMAVGVAAGVALVAIVPREIVVTAATHSSSDEHTLDTLGTTMGAGLWGGGIALITANVLRNTDAGSTVEVVETPGAVRLVERVEGAACQGATAMAAASVVVTVRQEGVVLGEGRTDDEGRWLLPGVVLDASAPATAPQAEIRCESETPIGLRARLRPVPEAGGPPQETWR